MPSTSLKKEERKPEKTDPPTYNAGVSCSVYLKVYLEVAFLLTDRAIKIML